MTILIPLFTCIIGAFVYGFASNPKLQELGRLAYATGLLVTLLMVGDKAISFLR